ncbi:MAG: hypothetical protein HZA49_05715 [Planctomycetes bacterium]|nr:hypothetical protein [Planctomycetota bacterium]
MKKAIVIASAVIAIILASIMIVILPIGALLLENPIRGKTNFFVVLITALVIIPISVLVICNVKLHKALRIPLVIISILGALFVVTAFVGLIYKPIDRPELFFLFIIYCLGLTAVMITLLTYIRRALWPAQK